MIGYLAGPIFGRTDEECRGWREQVKAAVPSFTWLDPMARDYRGKEDESVSDIVLGDKADIDGTQVVVVNLLHGPSAGTLMELLYAWEGRIRTITMVPRGKAVSPWIQFHSSTLVHSIEEAIEALTAGA